MADTQSAAAAFISSEAENRVSWEQSPDGLVTEAKNFFSQPQIIREEALFQCINEVRKRHHTAAQRHKGYGEEKNLKESSAPPCLRVSSFLSVKRSVIREFCEGSVNAVDLGALRVRQERGKVLLLSAKKEFSEDGFSLLIKEPGLYILNRISINVRWKLTLQVQPFTGQKESGGFIAGLPLVLRPCFKDDFIENMDRKIKKQDLPKGKIISAVDRSGVAAFLGLGGILCKRALSLIGAGAFQHPNDYESKGLYLLVVNIVNKETGGIDA
jgi:tRNA(Ile)-lysidine synthase